MQTKTSNTYLYVAESAACFGATAAKCRELRNARNSSSGDSYWAAEVAPDSSDKPVIADERARWALADADADSSNMLALIRAEV